MFDKPSQGFFRKYFIVCKNGFKFIKISFEKMNLCIGIQKNNL